MIQWLQVLIELKQIYTGKTKVIPVASDNTMRSHEVKRSVCAKTEHYLGYIILPFNIHSLSKQSIHSSLKHKRLTLQWHVRWRKLTHELVLYCSSKWQHGTSVYQGHKVIIFFFTLKCLVVIDILRISKGNILFNVLLKSPTSCMVWRVGRVIPSLN